MQAGVVVIDYFSVYLQGLPLSATSLGQMTTYFQRSWGEKRVQAKQTKYVNEQQKFGSNEWKREIPHIQILGYNFNILLFFKATQSRLTFCNPIDT